METRFQRYLTLSRRSSEPSQTGHALDDLETHSVPYEAIKPTTKAPIVISQPRRKSAITARRTKDEFAGLGIRAISYDSVLPGKPPIFGGRPCKGNGPIKLQTSRRLSSGELLTTIQDNKQTLEDIREGDYIVGRKEKRNSQLSQVKTSSPLLTGPASPPIQSSAATVTPRESSVPEQKQWLAPPTPLRQSDVSYSPGLAYSFRESPPASPGLLPPELLLPDSGYGIRNGATEHISAKPIPSVTTRTTVPSGTASLLTRGDEQNATIQALWKAEYCRLVAIYGQDGVDKNIAELSRDHQRPPSFEVLDGGRLPPTIMLQPLPKPSIDVGWTSNSPRNSRGSLTRDSGAFDNVSEYSSQKPSSIMSSEGSSSSHTKRTSLYEPELSATREDVRIMVESMRSNYLKAIESTTKVAEKTKTKRKPRARKSLPNAATAGSSPSPVEPPKTTRQSWHSSNGQITTKAEKKKAKTKLPAAQTPSPMLKASASKSSLKSRASLQRADSLTLGALLPQPRLSYKVAKSGGSPADQTNTSAQHAPSNSFEKGISSALWTTPERNVEAL
jgi:hypothetical protein